MSNLQEFFVRKFEPEPNTCFVLMPFDEGLVAVYEHGIKPAVEELGLKIKRADELYSGQSILGDIWQGIQSAEIVIADLTGKNPNVMYGLGLCHALWKKVILLSQIRDDVPFDLRAWRVLWYDFTFAGAVRLKEELHRAIEAVRREGSASESTLVPLAPGKAKVASGSSSHKGSLPGASTHTDSDTEWHFGEVFRWGPNSDFGFIKSKGEDFYFNEGHLFSETSEPQEGDRVVFHVLAPVADGKSRRASQIFVHGEQLQGKVEKIFEKGFGFVQIEGQHGNRHTLFVFTRDVPDLSIGSTVRCRVGENDRGPIGVDLEVVDSPD